MKAALFAIVLLCILLVPLRGKCAERWAVMSVASYHLERGGYCEINIGGGVEHPSIVYGVYRNSFCGPSYYLGGKYVPLKVGKWRGGLLGMGVTGYEDPVSLAAGLVIAYEGAENGLNVILFPNKHGQFSKGVAGLQWKVRW